MTISYEEQRTRFAEIALAQQADELHFKWASKYHAKHIADHCWQIADAMMAAREKPTEEKPSKPKVLNVNSTVRVKLTDHGRAVYENFWASASKGGPYFPPKEATNGQSQWTLLQLMQIFGPHMSLGSRPCFEADIEVVE